MGISPEQTTSPELIIGLVAPVGVDLDLVTEVLAETLSEMNYKTEAETFRLTRLMREISLPLNLPKSISYIQSIRERIKYANAVRSKLGDESLAALAVSAIRSFRKSEREKLKGTDAPVTGLTVDATERDEETPLPNRAYIIRQFKRPEEISLLRSIYGKQFILVSAYAPLDERKRRIARNERQSLGGVIDDIEAQNRAFKLVAQDSSEEGDLHGQNIRDAFPLGDVFIDARTRATCEVTIRRFIHLLFGDNEITPTHDEYGMYIAKSASLRSADLSRQVGAAIFRRSGEVVSLGCNEVPKAGGGTYWPDDQNDGRDFQHGHDPNDRLKNEILVDLIDRLRRTSQLSAELLKLETPFEIAKALLADKSQDGVAKSRLMDIIEFGRIIHAEMSAIGDAARKGVATEGSTLFCTTFPCHICAKHIVAAGLRRVVFLEPYPKSYASELHKDSISVEYERDATKVSFDPFIGVSPFRYRDLFEKGKRKYSGGSAQKWNRDRRRPMIEVYFPSYFQAETHVVTSLADRLAKVDSEAAHVADPPAALSSSDLTLPPEGPGSAPDK